MIAHSIGNNTSQALLNEVQKFCTWAYLNLFLTDINRERVYYSSSEESNM